MTAASIGTFGSYKIQWSRERQGLSKPKIPDISNEETVWVTKRYIPTDLRVNAPVARHKLIASDVKDLPTPDSHWIPPAKQTNPWAFSRDYEERGNFYGSQPSTRCEEWSTLRQMLPSTGRPHRVAPANWGTGFAQPPRTSVEIQRTFPHINSPMTRYVDAMHGTNRLFKLY